MFTEKRKATIEEALAQLPGPQGQRSVAVLEHGSLLVKVYAPRGHDPQTPHARDEVYLVAQGSGEFVSDQGRQSFGPQDLLSRQRASNTVFEHFTDDLIVWVMFYGPEGGEATAV